MILRTARSLPICRAHRKRCGHHALAHVTDPVQVDVQVVEVESPLTPQTVRVIHTHAHAR